MRQVLHGETRDHVYKQFFQPSPYYTASTGITQLHRYHEPLRHPRAPGLSLAGFQLVVALTTPWGFPCCVRFPCVHAAATTPAQRLGVLFRSVTQPCQPSPKGLSVRPAHRPSRDLLSVYFSLRPAHSRCHQFVTRIPVGVSPSAKTFTPKEGQYLAYIHLYTRLHRRPPAEADIQQYFCVTPPSVHQMVLTLERAGFITRQPRVARSIEVLVDPKLLPELL